MTIDRGNPELQPTRFSGDEGALSTESIQSPAVTRLLADGEIVLMVMRPSLWMVILWSLNVLLFILGLVFALAWASRFPWAGWTEMQAFGLGMVLVGIRLGWQFLDWANRLYILTDRRVIRRRGVFQVDVFEARLDRIQQTSVLQMVRERIFGLGSIAFATAGNNTLNAVWEVVRDPHEVQKAVADAIQRFGRGGGGV
ncbi:MAG: PH domain-containing protein [Phycisphaerales bacterium]|nr:PH domain-containing protein [Phycisphaerales bacterium]